MPIITMQNFSFQYANGTASAIRDVNLSICEGEFLVICGRSASGKSTLLRCLKESITPAGIKKGTVQGSIRSSEISVVFQNPDTQLVNNTVLSDLAFCMENLCVKNPAMRRRIAEVAGFFDIEVLLHRDPVSLSGGQKQLVVLCAAIMTHPRLLLLDEPVSQLDPIAARKIFDMLKLLNDELGTTIVMTEHRLDECIALADRLAVMHQGKLIGCNKAKTMLRQLSADPDGVLFVPDLPRLSMKLTANEKVCLNYKEWKNEMPVSGGIVIESKTKDRESDRNIITMKKVFFAYGKKEAWVINNLDIKIKAGQKLCLLGGNGSGKTTLLKIMAGMLSPIHGTIKNDCLKVFYLPQNVYSYFRYETVLKEILSDSPNDYRESPLFQDFGLSGALERHPLDLSGGEAVKLALFCILSKKPDLILLDEPTKGLDPYAKEYLANWLRQTDGAIICATHDLSFAARVSDMSAMLFDGTIAAVDFTKSLLSDNRYYTTQISRCLRDHLGEAVVFEDVM